MTFDVVAKEIIRGSISNALCIDDSFYEPYSFPKSQPGSFECDNFRLSKRLYESFRKENCVLDVHRYSDYTQWSNVKDNILWNKDLIVLDWELNETGNIDDTLKVLSDVIEKDNVLFVYIYTRATALGPIMLQVLSHLSSIPRSDLNSNYILLCQKLEKIIESDYVIVDEDLVELDLLEAHKIMELIKPNIENMMIFPNRYQDEYAEMMSKISLGEDLKNRFYKKLLTYGNQIFKCNSYTSENYQYLHIFKNILTSLNARESEVPLIKSFTFNWIFQENYSFLLNGKLIRIVTKKLSSSMDEMDNSIAPEHLFSDLSSSISKEPNNFLNLLGLEVRNIFREGSSIVGRDFPIINELAFFHHQKTLNVGDNTNFENFLLQLWEDDLSNYVHSNNLKIFSCLDSYKDEKNIELKLKNFDQELLNINLSRLNYYYCVSRNSKKTARNIEFGDIFQIRNEDGIGNKYEFLLCITQQCDCLRPKKINHLYHFVGGVKQHLNSGLSKVDSDLISFLVNEDVNAEPFSIKWHFKPFSIYIGNENNDISDVIRGKVCGHELQLKHVEKLKENYTQKIANHVFSDANRVGIDFAKVALKKEKNETKKRKGRRCNRNRHLLKEKTQ